MSAPEETGALASVFSYVKAIDYAFGELERTYGAMTEKEFLDAVAKVKVPVATIVSKDSTEALSEVNELLKARRTDGRVRLNALLKAIEEKVGKINWDESEVAKTISSTIEQSRGPEGNAIREEAVALGNDINSSVREVENARALHQLSIALPSFAPSIAISIGSMANDVKGRLKNVPTSASSIATNEDIRSLLVAIEDTEVGELEAGGDMSGTFKLLTSAGVKVQDIDIGNVLLRTGLTTEFASRLNSFHDTRLHLIITHVNSPSDIAKVCKFVATEIATLMQLLILAAAGTGEWKDESTKLNSLLELAKRNGNRSEQFKDRAMSREEDTEVKALETLIGIERWADEGEMDYSIGLMFDETPVAATAQVSGENFHFAAYAIDKALKGEFSVSTLANYLSTLVTPVTPGALATEVVSLLRKGNVTKAWNLLAITDDERQEVEGKLRELQTKISLYPKQTLHIPPSTLWHNIFRLMLAVKAMGKYEGALFREASDYAKAKMAYLISCLPPVERLVTFIAHDMQLEKAFAYAMIAKLMAESYGEVVTDDETECFLHCLLCFLFHFKPLNYDLLHSYVASEFVDPVNTKEPFFTDGKKGDQKIETAVNSLLQFYSIGELFARANDVKGLRDRSAAFAFRNSIRMFSEGRSYSGNLMLYTSLYICVMGADADVLTFHEEFQRGCGYYWKLKKSQSLSPLLWNSKQTLNEMWSEMENPVIELVSSKFKPLTMEELTKLFTTNEPGNRDWTTMAVHVAKCVKEKTPMVDLQTPIAGIKVTGVKKAYPFLNWCNVGAAIETANKNTVNADPFPVGFTPSLPFEGITSHTTEQKFLDFSSAHLDYFTENLRITYQGPVQRQGTISAMWEAMGTKPTREEFRSRNGHLYPELMCPNATIVALSTLSKRPETLKVFDTDVKFGDRLAGSIEIGVAEYHGLCTNPGDYLGLLSSLWGSSNTQVHFNSQETETSGYFDVALVEITDRSIDKIKRQWIEMPAYFSSVATRVKSGGHLIVFCRDTVEEDLATMALAALTSDELFHMLDYTYAIGYSSATDGKLVHPAYVWTVL